MLATTTTITTTSTPEPKYIAPEINSVADAVDLLKDSITGLVTGFVANLPVYLIALVVFFIGLVTVKFAIRAMTEAFHRGSVEPTLQKLALTIGRMLLLLVVTLVALSVAGVQVGAALAGLGILGLAFAFAFQNILENFIAGLLILMRKPFRIADQIRSGDFEGTVTDVNMRVTKITSYDGVKHLLPNADVFRNPLTNYTELGPRRTSVMIGIDYRDNIDSVPAIITAALRELAIVEADRPVDVLCTELGSSSVDFEIRYWTAPDSGSVTAARDQVLRAAKRSVEAVGMTIPWPITTLEPGRPLRLQMLDED